MRFWRTLTTTTAQHLCGYTQNLGATENLKQTSKNHPFCRKNYHICVCWLVAKITTVAHWELTFWSCCFLRTSRNMCHPDKRCYFSWWWLYGGSVIINTIPWNSAKVSVVKQQMLLLAPLKRAMLQQVESQYSVSTESVKVSRESLEFSSRVSRSQRRVSGSQ